MDKNFKFQGVDARTEWKLGLLLGVPSLLTFLLILWCAELLFPEIYFIYSLLIAFILTLAGSIFLLKLFARTIKNKNWTINVKNEILIISYNDKTYDFPLDSIRIIKNMGNVGFRYLTITTRNENIKIRVGNTGLVPFSTAKDILILDSFVEHIKPYLEQNFNKKSLKNQLNNDVFPNFGVYVTKSEEIRYSIVNKMKLWQILVVFGILGFAGIILLMAVLLKFLDS